MSIQYDVYETMIIDPRQGARIRSFAQEGDADQYIEENKDYAREDGFRLFVVPTSDK